MDFSKIKLVVSDMDGTLLNDKHEVSQRFYEQFKALKKRNIHFVAASGRQFQSIQHKLNPIKDEISIIGENGGIMQHANHLKVLLKLSKRDVLKCINRLRKIDGAYLVLCAKKTAYIESTNPKFLNIFKNYYNEIKQVKDLTQVTNDDFLKIAVFHFDSSEAKVYPHVKDLEDKYQVIVSGQNWLDISHIEANKGFALKIIQHEMGLTPKETLAFGDFNNDIELLKLAEMSFAMGNAHSNVKNIAKYMTKRNNEFGVETILEKLINSREINGF